VCWEFSCVLRKCGLEWNTQLNLQYTADFTNCFLRHPSISFSVVSLFLSQVDCNVDFFPHPYGARRRRLPPCAQEDGKPIAPKLLSFLSTNYQHTAVVGKANCEWGRVGLEFSANYAAQSSWKDRRPASPVSTKYVRGCILASLAWFRNDQRTHQLLVPKND